MAMIIGKKENNEWKQVGWKSPSNIALIKYWGKKNGQIPLNPSLSFTLKNSFTETTILYTKNQNELPQINFSFLFEGKPNQKFSYRIEKYLNSLVNEFPFLYRYQLKIESKNSFPHSAGIASSASSMSALALCLCSLEKEITGGTVKEDFFQRASNIARLGSGSACRSVYGGFNIWGKTNVLGNSSDKFAVPVKRNINKIFQNLCDSVIIIDSGSKTVSSSEGHSFMNSHPGKTRRIIQANNNLFQLLKVIETSDFTNFSTIVEEEALSIHELMRTSNPSFSLLKPETFEVIERVKYYREKKSMPVSFTLDAGPNVHLIFPLDFKNKMTKFIGEELAGFCESGNWLDDRIGEGPELNSFKLR